MKNRDEHTKDHMLFRVRDQVYTRNFSGHIGGNHNMTLVMVGKQQARTRSRCVRHHTLIMYVLVDFAEGLQVEACNSS